MSPAISAAVIGAISIAAKQKLPLHVVALVPSTDNRPGGKAFAPGDVLKMHSALFRPADHHA